MKVYLAGSGRPLVRKDGTASPLQGIIERRLFSYYHNVIGNQPDEEVWTYEGLDLFLDSGAFTAYTKGVEIRVEELAEYYHAAPHLWNVVSNLDDIGGPEKNSYDNWRALLDLGVPACPVFHQGSDPAWLKKYLDETDYIFIGGLVGGSTKALRGWLDWLWTDWLTDSDGRPVARFHGFGLTDQELMFRYPWHSVDSASWLMTGMFGSCVFITEQGLRKVVFSEQSPEARQVDGWHYDRLPPLQQRQVEQWVARYGVTVEQLKESFEYRDVINASAFKEMESMGAERFINQQMGLFDA